MSGAGSASAAGSALSGGAADDTTAFRRLPASVVFPVGIRPGHRAGDMSEEQARLVLQSFARMLGARRKASRRATRAYIKVLDEQYGVPYYFNRYAGTSHWEKPWLLQDLDKDTVSVGSMAEDLQSVVTSARSSKAPDGSVDVARVRHARDRGGTRSVAGSVGGMYSARMSARTSARPSARESGALPPKGDAAAGSRRV